MILNVFAIMDVKAGFFQIPFFCPSVGQAVRACMDLAADPASTLSRYPGDFALYQIGTWDDHSGHFESSGFVHLGSGVSFLPKSVSQGKLFTEDAAQ